MHVHRAYASVLNCPDPCDMYGIVLNRLHYCGQLQRKCATVCMNPNMFDLCRLQFLELYVAVRSVNMTVLLMCSISPFI